MHRQLAEGRDLRLDKDGGLLWVNSHRQVVQGHFMQGAADLLRVTGVIGQGLLVGNHDVGIVLAGVLQGHPVLQRADIVTDVELPRWPVPG